MRWWSSTDRLNFSIFLAVLNMNNNGATHIFVTNIHRGKKRVIFLSKQLHHLNKCRMMPWIDKFLSYTWREKMIIIISCIYIRLLLYLLILSYDVYDFFFSIWFLHQFYFLLHMYTSLKNIEFYFWDVSQKKKFFVNDKFFLNLLLNWKF